MIYLYCGVHVTFIYCCFVVI